MLSTLFKGCLIGFSIAMPVGPIGLLCIKNSLNRGMVYGLMAGLGAACADTLYGALVGFGISAIGVFLEKYQLALELFGGIFLCYLGIVIFLEKLANTSDSYSKATHWNVFFSTFILTLTNPMTFLSFAGIYAGLGVGSLTSDLFTPIIITCGVFIGSLVWWLILSSCSAYFKDKLNDRARIWLNKISGSVILSFGLFALISFASKVYY